MHACMRACDTVALRVRQQEPTDEATRAVEAELRALSGKLGRLEALRPDGEGGTMFRFLSAEELQYRYHEMRACGSRFSLSLSLSLTLSLSLSLSLSHSLSLAAAAVCVRVSLFGLGDVRS
jgi:hypothetical protein